MPSSHPYHAPSRLIFGSLSDERGRFNRYWSRLEELDVRTPTTRLFPVDECSRDTWPVESIRDWMTENGWSEAFVRGMDKAAPQRLEAGSFIEEPTQSEITNTLESLIVQLDGSPWSLGGAVAVRDRLDMDFCMNPNHEMCHPEIRFFIEDGKVLSHTPSEVGETVTCPQQYEYLADVVDEKSLPIAEARKVAEAFPEHTWGVDFALDTQGNWYCLELNFNGVRWDEDTADWVNICGHGESEAYSPRIIHDTAIRHARRERR